MRVCVISDIHGNYSALKKCIRESKKLNVEKYLCLGDYVGYYYEPEKCIDLLLNLNAVCIKGNHETVFFKTLESKKKAEKFSKIYGNSIFKNLKLLKKKHIVFLKSLRSQFRFSLNKKKFFLAHGSPWNKNFYLYPNVKEVWFKKLLKYKFDYCVLGHTHIPMIKNLTSNKVVLNPGSIGQPRNKSANAQWLIFDTKSKKITQKNSSYSLKRIKKQISKYDSNNMRLLKYFKK